MLNVEQFIEAGLLRVLVDDSVLSSIDLHAMARQHVYHEVLLLGSTSDALSDVTTRLADLFLGRIGKVFYVASINVKKSEHSLKLCDVCIN